MKNFIFYRADIINISSIIHFFLSEGIHVKTVQFWLMYIDMMKMQHQAHTAMKENNYDLRLDPLQQFLSLYFNFNMHNYARYGAYYAEVLRQIGTLHPGLKDALSLKGLSKQAQDRYPLQQLSANGRNKLSTVMEKLVMVSGMLPLHHHLY